MSEERRHRSSTGMTYSLFSSNMGQLDQQGIPTSFEHRDDLHSVFVKHGTT